VKETGRGERPRVAVTGLGAVSSIGTGRRSFWEGLLAGRSGVGPIRSFDTSDYRVKIGGEVHGFRMEDFLPRREAGKYGRASQLAIAAALLAVEDAGLPPAPPESPAAVLLGSTMGECREQEAVMRAWHRGGPGQVRLRNLARLPDSLLACNVMSALGMGASGAGPTGLWTTGCTFPTACAAGNYAISYAYELIRRGDVSVALAGGCDAFSELAFAGFGRLMNLARQKCQPFDKNRTGIVIGEGAGILVLESLEHVRARGGRIYAELLGYGMSCDAHHMTIPHVDGVTAAMEAALEDAGVAPAGVSFVSTHGTGTRMNDKTECQALRRVFGNRMEHIPVNAVKSMLGHTMGAASALAAIGCALTVHEGRIPPTINFETADEECPVDCVPNTMREQPVEIAMNNAYAFGGNNCVTVFARFES